MTLPRSSLYGDIDVYDESSSRQTFAHWDVQCIQWLEAEGYWVDYCTPTLTFTLGRQLEPPLQLRSPAERRAMTNTSSRKMRQNMTAR